MKYDFYIITVCFNSEKTIQRTISSVINQTFKNYQYIIIDGGSTDNTLKIIEKNRKFLKNKLILVSEKDHGIYDAMNKGIKLVQNSEGFINFLNSDDNYYSKKTLENVLKFNNNDFIYGKIAIQENQYKIYSGKPVKLKLIFKNLPHQPSVFLKKSVFLKLGFFSDQYKISSDFDFFIRVFKSNSISKFFLDLTLTTMSPFGVSNSNILRTYYEKIIIIYRNLDKILFLKAFIYVYFYEFPRNLTRVFLVKLDLIKYWRKIKAK